MVSRTPDDWNDHAMLDDDLNGFLAILDESPMGISMSRRRDGVIIYVNRRFADLMGDARERFVGTPARQYFSDAGQHAEIVRSLKRDGGLDNVDMAFQRMDGAPIWALLTIRAAVLNGEAVNLAWISDIGERRQSEAQLRRLSMAVEQAPVTVMVTGRDGLIEYVNRAFCRITGFSAGEAIGQNPRLLKSGQVPDEVYRAMWSTLSAGGMWQGELCNRKKDGGLYWEYATISPVRDGSGVITHFLAVKEDITLRKEYESRLRHQASHDALTGLPTRALASDRLWQAIAAAGRSGNMIVVMLVVLDGLDKVNNSLGFKAGDAAIVAFAQRLQALVRHSDTLARLGGNEFLIVVGDIGAPAVAEISALRILDDCRKSYPIDGRNISLAARIGMTVYPSDGADPSVLIRNAHAASLRSEERGGNNFRFFTPRMDEEAQARLRIESGLQSAIERNELDVFYQPIVAAGSREIIGAEALMRWSHPEMGAIAPDRFIPIAESSDLIVPLSNWLLRRACKDARRWRQTLTHFKLAVNFSPRQFRHSDLVQTIVDIMEAEGLPRDCLEVEVTERLLMGESGNAKIILDTMKGFDISISIDDFGTGYSSLSYLQNYQFDTLKIDRSFVREVDVSASARSLACAIIEMARALSMDVVAEGVETREQETILTELGCQSMQGYLFGRPMPAGAFDVLMDR